jgi:hypothetical protein
MHNSVPPFHAAFKVFRTLDDPSTIGTTSFRLLIHKDWRVLCRASRVLKEAYASNDDQCIADAEDWLAIESDVHWFAQDGSWWDMARDEGALDCLGWTRSVVETPLRHRVTVRRHRT